MSPKKHEKKIREIIDRNLSGSDEFTVQFDNDALSIKSAKRSVIHHMMFIAFIVVPVFAILWNDRSFYSIMVSVFYFSALGYRYFKSVKYQVNTVFKLKERVLIYENLVFSELFDVEPSVMKFEELGLVELSSVGWRSKGVRIAFRSASKRRFPILELNDEFKAKRLKFILTEIVK